METKRRPKRTLASPRHRLARELLETVDGLERAGLMERADARKITMRLLDDASIPEFRAVTAREVAETRHKMGLSQPVLAKYLGVSPSIVAKWERGAAVPSRSAQYVLRLVGRRGLSALGELSQSPSPRKRRRSG